MYGLCVIGKQILEQAIN